MSYATEEEVFFWLRVKAFLKGLKEGFELADESAKAAVVRELMDIVDSILEIYTAKGERR